MVPFRLPSVDVVAAAAERAVRRFPDVLLAAAAAVVIAWRLVDADGTLPRWEAAMAAAVLGLPLLLAGALLAEGRGWQGVHRALPPLACSRPVCRLPDRLRSSLRRLAASMKPVTAPTPSSGWIDCSVISPVRST